MKKLLLSLAVIAASIGAQAQDSKTMDSKLKFSLGLEAALPVGDFNKTSSFGIGGSLQGDYWIDPTLAITLNSGYVLKNLGKEELITALEKIADGGIYFSPEVLEEMIKASERKKNSEEIHLTGRETEIIRLIEKEQSNKQIADGLFISERTVETHRKNIFRKTKTSGLIGLIKYAYEHNLIEQNA